MEEVLITNANVLQIADPSGDASGIGSHGIGKFSTLDTPSVAQSFDFAGGLTP